jgi:hypothetical protein
MHTQKKKKNLYSVFTNRSTDRDRVEYQTTHKKKPLVILVYICGMRGIGKNCGGRSPKRKKKRRDEKY